MIYVFYGCRTLAASPGQVYGQNTVNFFDTTLMVTQTVCKRSINDVVRDEKIKSEVR